MKSDGKNLLRVIFNAVLITLFISINAVADDFPPLSPNKAWFKPSLIENNSPVCQHFLNNANTAFFGSNFYSNYQSENDEVLISGAYDSSGFDHVLINSKAVYVRIVLRHGCGGACEGEQAFASTSPIDEAMRYVNDFSESQRQLMSPVTTINNTLFIKAGDGNYYLISSGSSIEINQLKVDASWEKTCEISISPTEAQYADFANADQLREIFKKLESSLSPVLGGYGNCGSSNAGGRRWHLLKQLSSAASYRPWVLNQSKNNIKNSFNYLENWSLLGLHQFNSYTNFNEEIKVAIPSVKDIYSELYGLNDKHANQMANLVINSIVANVISPASPSQQEDRRTILKVLFEKADLSTIKSITTDIKLLDKVEGDGFAYDSLLVAAIDYPEALQYLLEQGLDPNQQNEFGKTPLMYAAQNNQFESIALLLSKKAAPNLSTIIPLDTCYYTLSKSGMHALHYAVRYASPEVIKLLIENGADPIVTTSEREGGYPIDWLHKYTAADAEEPNKNIPASEIPALEKLLSLPSAEEMKKLVLKYNTGAEKAYTENNLQEAYVLIQKALQLQPVNERALSNLGLIAMKMEKNEIALEAIKKLIDHGTDKKMVANAWYNYGMICDTTKGRVYYKDNTYCTSSRIHNYLSSYLAAPSEARKNKLFDAVEGSAKACHFKDGKIRVLTECGSSSFENKICVIYPSETSIDLSGLSGSYKNQIPTKKKFIVTEEVPVYLNNASKTYEMGDKTFGVYYPKGRLNLPIKWDGETCNEDFSVTVQ